MRPRGAGTGGDIVADISARPHQESLLAGEGERGPYVVPKGSADAGKLHVPPAPEAVSSPTSARLRAGTGRRVHPRDRSNVAPHSTLADAGRRCRSLVTICRHAVPSSPSPSRPRRRVDRNSAPPETIGAARVIRPGGTAIANPPVSLIL